MKEQLKNTLIRLAKINDIQIQDIRVGIEKENDKIVYYLWNRNQKLKILSISDVINNTMIIPLVKAKINKIFKIISKNFNGNIIEVRLYIKGGDLKGNIIKDYVPTENFDFDKYL